MATTLHRNAAVALAWALAAGITATAPATAHAAGAHQHGVASLELVADGNSLTVTLDSPLDNLLGFERGPRTDAERAKVRAMAQTLRTNATLVVPAAAAGCPCSDKQRKESGLWSGTLRSMVEAYRPPWLRLNLG
jgi:hypothetical protein